MANSNNVQKHLFDLSRSTELQEIDQIRSELMSVETSSLQDELIKSLDSDDSDVRWRAAELLMEIDFESHAEKIIKLLFDPDPNIRSSVCYHISGFSPCPDAIDPLCTVLQSDQDSNVRFWAAFALGEIGDLQALKVLNKSALSDMGLNYEGVSVAEAAINARKKLTGS